MRAFTTRPAAPRRRSATGLLYLVISGLLWGTGGLTAACWAGPPACPRFPWPRSGSPPGAC